MNSEFLEDEEIIRITNEEFIAINRNDLGGKYDIKLNISTAEADEQKGSELAFMLQTMGNTMPPEMSQMILADIAKLRKMPDLAKRIAEYQPQPNPLAQHSNPRILPPSSAANSTGCSDHSQKIGTRNEHM